jgi:hypothetical protein
MSSFIVPGIQVVRGNSTPVSRESNAAGDHPPGTGDATTTVKAVAFRNDMPALWDIHRVWTHAVIVSFICSLP